MNLQELKSAVTVDVETIKTLNPEIIPASVYYLSLLKCTAIGLTFFWLVISLCIAYAGIHYPSNDELARETLSEIFSESVLMAFFMSIGGILILLPSIVSYLQFHFHLENKLLTGIVLKKKFKQFAVCFMITFLLLCALFASGTESAVIFFTIGLSFFGSLFLTYVIVSMEISRLGLTVLFTAINQFRSPDKPDELTIN